MRYHVVAGDAEAGAAQSGFKHTDAAHADPALRPLAVRVLLLVTEAVLAWYGIVWYTWLFHSPYCNILFRCGCTWEFKGGWKNCNIHDPNLPHCPWCAATLNTSWTTDYLVQALMLALYAFLRWRAHKSQTSLLKLVAEVVTWESLLFAGHGLVVAFIFKLATGYPYFLWFGEEVRNATVTAGAHHHG